MAEKIMKKHPHIKKTARFLFEYPKFILNELIMISTYINALIVGAAINYFSGNGLPGMIVPYIIPVIVQAFAKASVNYKYKHKDRLLDLPAKRESPAFIMNEEGDIKYSIGLTSDFFNKHGIKNIGDFIDIGALNKIIENSYSNGIDGILPEVYSGVSDKWYDIKSKEISSVSKHMPNEYLVWFMDVTKRKKVEIELKKQAAFVNENPAPVILASSDDTIISANPAAEKIFKKKLEGELITKLLPGLEDAISSESGNNGQFQFEKEIHGKTYLFTFKTDPRTKSLYIYGSDITRLKNAERDLKNSEERYALAQQAANIGSWEWDVITNNLYWSETIEKMFGYKKGGFEGTYESFLNRVHEDDRQFVFDTVNYCIKNDTDYEQHHRIIKLDGEVRWVSETGKIHKNIDGEPVRMFGIVQDITERKIAEEQINRLMSGIEQAYDSVVITDAKGDIQYVNPSFERITGYSKEEVIGKNPRILKSSEHSEKFYKIMWDTIKGGETWEGEIINKRFNGELYHEYLTITPVKNNKNEIVNYVAIKRDVSEKKILEEKIERLRRENEAFMRHELKNLITPVKGYAELLFTVHNKGMDEKQLSFCGKIKEYSDRIVMLIDKLKSLQDFELGKYDIQKTENDLNKVVLQAINDVQMLASDNNVNINFENNSEKSTFQMDVGLMPGVFVNLIKNAVEHVGNLEDEIEKIVRIEMFNKDGKLIVKINNKGELIPSGKLKLFFEKFNSDRIKKSEGTGLGTTYAYLVTKAHNGDIFVDSNEKEGTTLTLRFNA